MRYLMVFIIAVLTYGTAAGQSHDSDIHRKRRNLGRTEVLWPPPSEDWKPSAPPPKAESEPVPQVSPENVNSRFKPDLEHLKLALIGSAALSADRVTITRCSTVWTNCAPHEEFSTRRIDISGRADRFAINFGLMYGGMKLGEWMRRRDNFLRHIWFVPPVAAVAGSIYTRRR